MRVVVVFCLARRSSPPPPPVELCDNRIAHTDMCQHQQALCSLKNCTYPLALRKRQAALLGWAAHSASHCSVGRAGKAELARSQLKVDNLQKLARGLSSENKVSCDLCTRHVLTLEVGRGPCHTTIQQGTKITVHTCMGGRWSSLLSTDADLRPKKSASPTRALKRGLCVLCRH